MKKLRGLNDSSSPGPDGIHPKILKEGADFLAKPLTTIFNKSLESSILPRDWLMATVVPIHKKGPRQQPANYRPISLTSIPCKILESVIRDELMEHLSTNNHLSQHQHGFRPRRSCSSQLLEALNEWSLMLERGDSVDAVYLDFQKAFDSVPHMRLITKLRKYGVTGKLLDWIRAFLTGRKQQVLVGGQTSTWAPVVSGVPQGSVLGPTLFVVYINDLPETVQNSIKMFADDTKIYTNVSKHRTIQPPE